MTDLEHVKYQGGPLHGAVLEMSAALAEKALHMRLVISAGGNVVDRSRGWVLMPSIRIVQPPQPRLPEVTAAPRKRSPRRKKP